MKLFDMLAELEEEELPFDEEDIMEQLEEDLLEAEAEATKLSQDNIQSSNIDKEDTNAYQFNASNHIFEQENTQETPKSNQFKTKQNEQEMGR